MKKLIYLIALIAILASCKNTPIIEQLSINEVSSLLKKDTLYEFIISQVELIREDLNNDIVLQSKFKDLTYKDLLSGQFELNMEERIPLSVNSM